ncbi:MAG: ubiquinol-cytochrome c reductase iron-sulfur subunit [Halofilum sp. (in: g-proteobacteria)]|nr:ubiquinol-cytochrome c reductase iron-sulfur subunit [Halofilum sp. (in: g-proteobacteria)]
MASDEMDPTRRRFLTGATTVVGGAGLLAGIVPFVNSMSVSARAQAAGAPVEVNIGRLEPGQRVTYEWRGKPVWVVRRTDRMLETLAKLEPQLADPESAKSEQPPYCQNPARAREERRDTLVMVGVCTHLGCSPSYFPEPGGELGSDWLGGFFCPCHGSKYDIAGRVYAGQPAPTNMPVPPYMYASENILVIGEDERG